MYAGLDDRLERGEDKQALASSRSQLPSLKDVGSGSAVELSPAFGASGVPEDWRERICFHSFR